MQLRTLVETYAAIRRTSSRLAKTQAASDVLRRAEPDQVPLVVNYLSGDLPQGKIGLGFATVGNAAAVPAAESTLRLSDVDGRLGEIKATTGAGSKKRKTELLQDLLHRATADEQDFVRRLLVGSLRQGALEGIMADAVAAAAEVPAPLVRRAAMLTGDLPAVAASALSAGAEGLADFGLEIFTAVQPMLAKTAPSVAEAFDKISPAAVEWKVDGARVQVHRLGDRIQVYTRSLRDITVGAGDIVEIVSGLDVDSIILDGEALGWYHDDRPADFQDTMSTFSSDGDVGLRVLFFDCLHLNGVDLIDRSADDRRAAMESALTPELLIPRLETSDPDQAQQYFDNAIAQGYEGVMVKSPTDAYEAGRRGAGWLKVKPVHTLDLVVLAVEWGSGRRRGRLSNIHLGARNGDEPGNFVMLGKTFKGMTDEMLEWQTERFLELETHRDGYVVHVRPEQVVEIAVDGIQRSSRYPGGVALRFARVKRYRSDRSAESADTLATVKALGRT